MESSAEYMGHCIDSSGVHTMMEKVKAILNAPVPQNAQQLRSLIGHGLLHYYGKFVDNLSSLLYSLNQLLRVGSS